MPDKPYCKKLETIEEFDVWEVDGKYIRDNIDREFTNFGQHFRFPFIPTHEFWIDKQFSADESRFFLDHLILEWNLMNEGKTYEVALTKADAVEIKERKKSALMKKEKITSLTAMGVPRNLYKEKIAENKGVAVWVVRGEIVRDLYFIDFTEGGHHFVYDFVPFKEVWIDDELNPSERAFVMLHELHERYLMYKGMPYHNAHHSSSIIEYKCRRDPPQLNSRMDIEVEKNKLVV